MHMDKIKAIQKDTITHLTPRGIKSLLDKTTKSIICQILELDKFQKKDITTADKYRGQISDGFTKFRCIFANNAAINIEKEKPNKYALIQITEIIINSNEMKQLVVIIIDYVLINNNIQEEIGQPIEYKEYASKDYNNPHGSNQIPPKYIQKTLPNTTTNTHNTFNRPITVAGSTGGFAGTNTEERNKPALANTLPNQQQQQQQQQQPIQRKPLVPQSTNPLPNTNNTSANTITQASLSTKSNTTATKKPSISFTNNSTNPTRNTNLPKAPEEDYMLIKHIAPYQYFMIKARIIQKSEIRKYNKNGQEGQVFSIDLIDETPSEIQGSFFKEAVDKWYPLLEVGKVYMISEGQVKVVAQKLQGMKNDYQIYFDQSSIFKEVPDNGSIPYYKFDFIKIPDTQTKDVGSLVDIAGFISNPGECQEIQLKSGEMKMKKTIHIYDDTLTSIELTLWGQQAQSFIADKDTMLIIKNARVGEFNSRKNLASVSSTQFFMNNLPEDNLRVQELYKWKQSTTVKDGDLISSSMGDQSKRIYKTLAQIESETGNMEQDKMIFDVRASVAHIKTETNLYYLACSNSDKCQKKVAEDQQTGEWRCDSCGTSTNNPQVRYTLSVNLVDSSGSLWISCFDKIAETLVGVSAKDLKCLKDGGDDSKVVDILREITSQEYCFRIISKVDNYNSDRRIRHNAIVVRNINYVQDNKDILKMLSLYDNLNSQWQSH